MDKVLDEYSFIASSNEGAIEAMLPAIGVTSMKIIKVGKHFADVFQADGWYVWTRVQIRNGKAFYMKGKPLTNYQLSIVAKEF